MTWYEVYKKFSKGLGNYLDGPLTGKEELTNDHVAGSLLLRVLVNEKVITELDIEKARQSQREFMDMVNKIKSFKEEVDVNSDK